MLPSCYHASLWSYLQYITRSSVLIVLYTRTRNDGLSQVIAEDGRQAHLSSVNTGDRRADSVYYAV